MFNLQGSELVIILLLALVVGGALATAMVHSRFVERAGLPVIIPVTEFRDIFGVALTNMIGGADPKAELEKATEQFRPVLEKSERS